MKDCKMHSPQTILDLDLTALPHDWEIDQNNVVRMMNWGYLASSEIASLPTQHKIPHVPLDCGTTKHLHLASHSSSPS